MAVFEVQIQGLDQLVKSLNNAPSVSTPILQRAIDASQAVLAKNTLKDDPVPWRTGNLLHSFRFQSGNLQARWFPTANYASFVEYGRGYVYPVKGNVLSWKDQTGKTIFARYAKPSKPRPFMAQIVAKSQGGIEQLFRQALDMIVTKIANIGN